MVPLICIGRLRGFLYVLLLHSVLDSATYLSLFPLKIVLFTDLNKRAAYISRVVQTV